MNPVDHPHGGVSNSISRVINDLEDLTVLYRVTINISVRRPRSRGTLPRVKRRVLLLREELVCCAVPRRRRIKAFKVLHAGLGFIGLHWSLLCRYGTAEAGGKHAFPCKCDGRKEFKKIPKFLTMTCFTVLRIATARAVSITCAGVSMET